ncbi:MAG: DUF4440 domain-containing protein [Chloroflexi bacterium]|nr:DUF4440 domain-containing protein [Chloroflexota bacterium]
MTMLRGIAEEIEQRNKLFEANFKTGNMEALADAYTEDATVMPPDAAPIRGRAAIQQFWQSVRDSGVQAVSLNTVSVDAEANMAAEIGTADLAVQTPGGETSSVPVKYVVIWKRQPGQAWQLAVDIWNSRPAAS